MWWKGQAVLLIYWLSIAISHNHRLPKLLKIVVYDWGHLFQKFLILFLFLTNEKNEAERVMTCSKWAKQQVELGFSAPRSHFNQSCLCLHLLWYWLLVEKYQFFHDSEITVIIFYDEQISYFFRFMICVTFRV